jgi:hypothetical protein
MGMGVKRHAVAVLPPGMTRDPLYPPEFDLQNIQPIASSYTDCTIPAHNSVIALTYIT